MFKMSTKQNEQCVYGPFFVDTYTVYEIQKYYRSCKVKVVNLPCNSPVAIQRSNFMSFSPRSCQPHQEETQILEIDEGTLISKQKSIVSTCTQAEVIQVSKKHPFLTQILRHCIYLMYLGKKATVHEWDNLNGVKLIVYFEFLKVLITELFESSSLSVLQ